MSRPLEGLTRGVVRFPVCTLLLAGAAVAVAIWLSVTQLGFRTSRGELLSPHSDYNRRWLEYTKEFGDKEDVVVLVEGEGRAQIVPVLDDVCRVLAQRSDLYGAVMHETDAPRLREKGLYYLKPEELQQIDGFLDQAAPILRGDWSQLNLGAMARWMGEAMAGGSEAQRQQMLAAMRSELPRFVGGLHAALGQAGAYRSPWPDMSFSSPLANESALTRLISDDSRMGYVLLRLLDEDKQNFAQNDASITILRQMIGEVKSRHPGIKVGLTGLPIIEYDEMRSSETSMTYATVLSFLGVLAVMIVAFGGFRHATMTMAALVIGMVWACGGVALFVGHINVLSIAFGSILFGLGIDYGIYFITHYLNQRKQTESTAEAIIATSRTTGPGILTGALTSSIAFFAAGFTEFPGVAQLGVIAGGGVLLCWLAQSTVLPAMICLTDSDGVKKNLPVPLNLRFWLRPLFAYPRLSLFAGTVLTAVAAVGMHYLKYDYNLLNLQPEGLESVELEHKLFSQTNRSAWFALSVAATPEEVLARKEAFLRLPSVERVVEVASKMPTDVELKRPVIERIHRRLATLPGKVPNIPVIPSADLDRTLAGAQAMMSSLPDADQASANLRQLREMLRHIPPNEYQRRVSEYQQAMAGDLLARLQKLKNASTPEPPRWTDFPEGVACRFVGKTGQYAMQVYGKVNIWDVEPMAQFVREVRSVDPEITGNPLQVYEASRQMKQSFQHAACYALLIIVPVVLLDFRRLNHTLLAALPMGVGLLQTLGLMGLLDIPLNQANMIFLPLTLGIGLDTGINLMHEMRSRRGKYQGAGNAVIVAVVVNSLTTMAGFGALMIADHQGLQSLGRVLTIAMGCCLFSSLLLPNLLVLGRFASDEKTSDAPGEESGDDLFDESDAPTEEPSLLLAA